MYGRYNKWKNSKKEKINVNNFKINIDEKRQVI